MKAVSQSSKRGEGVATLTFREVLQEPTFVICHFVHRSRSTVH